MQPTVTNHSQEITINSTNYKYILIYGRHELFFFFLVIKYAGVQLTSIKIDFIKIIFLLIYKIKLDSCMCILCY